MAADGANLLEEAQAAVKRKDNDTALELLNRAVEEDPSAAAFTARAQLQNRLHNHMEAADDAKQAIELDPAVVAAHTAKGHAYFQLEEFESAKEAFEAAQALEPGKLVHKQWVQMCRARMGETPEPPPQRTSSPPRSRPAADSSSVAGPSTSAGSGGGSSGGNNLSLSGDELKRFLAAQQLQSRAQEAQRARAAEEEAETSAAPRNATVDDPEFSKYWSNAISPAIIATLPEKPAGKYRHQWFQVPDKVEVNVLAKGLCKDRVSVSVERRHLTVSIAGSGGEEEYSLSLQLHGEVIPEESKYSVLSTKLEIRLKKAAAGEHWPELEERAGGAVAPAAAPAAEQAGPGKASAAYPYAGKRVDWNELESQLKKEEKEEKLEGDAALNKFFKELYQGGDEDMRRAMMKSMQESGGTALSTNWKEVAQKTYKPGSDN